MSGRRWGRVPARRYSSCCGRQQRTTLGTSELRDGVGGLVEESEITLCFILFDLPLEREATSYEVKFAGLDSPAYTHEELVEEDWLVTLMLRSPDQ